MKTPLSINFKKIIFILGIFAFLSLESYAQNAERIRFVFCTRSKPAANGDGCDGEKGLCIRFFSSSKTIGTGEGIAEVQTIRGQLQLNIITDNSPAEENENTFYVYEDKILPQEIAEQLGFSRVTIRKGEYRLDKSRNRLGTVMLNAIFQ
ncbi:MAG: hypothetical protein IPK10_15970 [Bacteroidetes bacterium]|nr:hypothetical protein [Bacteroidota bacterium]